MQLTIDSSEPLDRVLKVVSSLYGVQLAPAGDESPETATAEAAPAKAKTEPAAPRRGRNAAQGKSTGRTRPAKAAEKDDSAAVRSWARLNGHDVRDRGRIPAALVAAYKQSARDAK